MKHVFSKKNQILLAELVRTDFKVRYQNSVLGYFWTLLRPLFLFAILYVVFVKILKTGGGIPHFGVYLLLGIVLWNYFVEVTSGGVGAIVGKGDMMRKINFPRYIIVVAGSFAALINLLFNLLIVAIFLGLAGAQISPTAIFFPLIILELFVFSLSIAFLLSALFVKYRDISFIWEVGIQAAFFAIPIMYAFSFITSKSMLLGKILISNPMAQLIQDSRYMLVTSKTETVYSIFGGWWAYIIPMLVMIVVGIMAAIYFKRRAPDFAENV